MRTGEGGGSGSRVGRVSAEGRGSEWGFGQGHSRRKARLVLFGACQHDHSKCHHGSEELEKAVTVDFKKAPRAEQGWGQSRPKVRGRFAFPRARNPRA